MCDGWQPVTAADGKVLGWMAAPDDPEVLAEERARQLRIVALRAQAMDQAADLFMDDAVDPGQTWDTAEEAGLPGVAIDAAAHIGVVLREIEIKGPDAG